MDANEMAVVDTMEKYGGSFVKALAEAFRHADRYNFLKLQTAFMQYWKEYELKEYEDRKSDRDRKRMYERN